MLLPRDQCRVRLQWITHVNCICAGPVMWILLRTSIPDGWLVQMIVTSRMVCAQQSFNQLQNQSEEVRLIVSCLTPCGVIYSCKFLVSCRPAPLENCRLVLAASMIVSHKSTLEHGWVMFIQLFVPSWSLHRGIFLGCATFESFDESCGHLYFGGPFLYWRNQSSCSDLRMTCFCKRSVESNSQKSKA